ncbi:hypothetical protein B4U79_18420 [Dinothrombium tinctorium]|uniref:Ig-like domain-containing protein n=1 Tax=Dinothrombium tinctorium TaxID=1965070 RepID=A0A3S3Q2D4_9ACAR|nr:hypothetical protein B4U79_18517 [Dinothrombium tinctorium]RWS02279.1 hypothetical protein B4U79_18505 [Dinothrombium tinctorium]RWS02281.1 hypothetical protein B4U79_18504 [Dinothrombium tinctorium]RWS03583.1 hypothetical protein B4U79_18420 [Dinothrombium tinctorium]
MVISSFTVFDDLILNQMKISISYLLNAAWVKVIGTYDYQQPIPPFECANRCYYSYINALNDFRYRVITIGQTSILHIYDFQNSDYGIYRCTATGLATDGSTNTLYQVIEFIGRNK